MTRSAATTRAPVEAWGVENMRCTVFHTMPTPDVVGMWRRIVGVDPESVTSQPKVQSHFETGEWGTGRLTLAATNRRVDWRYERNPREENEPLPFTSVCVDFLALMRQWLALRNLLGAVRMAYGSTVTLPVDNVAAGYRTLCNYLPFDIDWNSGREFLYQINRPRPCAVVPTVEVNRLTRWSVSTTTRITFSAVGHGMVGSAHEQLFSNNCRIELDFNTAPIAGVELPEDRLAQLLEELVRLVEESIREGDIP